MEKLTDIHITAPGNYLITFFTGNRLPLLGWPLSDEEYLQTHQFCGIIPNDIGWTVLTCALDFLHYHPRLQLLHYQLGACSLHLMLQVREPLPVPLNEVLSELRLQTQRVCRMLHSALLTHDGKEVENLWEPGFDAIRLDDDSDVHRAKEALSYKIDHLMLVS